MKAVATRSQPRDIAGDFHWRGWVSRLTIVSFDFCLSIFDDFCLRIASFDFYLSIFDDFCLGIVSFDFCLSRFDYVCFYEVRNTWGKDGYCAKVDKLIIHNIANEMIN